MIDFDAFLAEARSTRAAAKPVQIRVGGKVYDLPVALPAVVALDIVRLKKEAARKSDGIASIESLMSIGEALFGGEAFHQLLVDNAFGPDDLGLLITKAFDAYDGQVSAKPGPKSKGRTRATST